ncbi:MULTISPECIES: hypothetical protein [unclassified Flavobacterium]|jgi:hypothetical protein|uniref:hypothetical protein n=1 Tax=unclassified Flavobacterium TaxID=196869 RepID=UPI0025B80CC7|nr:MULTISPECIES: hypothetical protein [unclassified Flavobacterium]
MKPTLELLIEDIKYDIIEIENTNEIDFVKVYNIYTSIYNRCENLKRESFESDEKFERFSKSITLYRSSDFITEEWLKDGVDFCISNNYSKIREDLKMLSSYLRIAQ